MTKKANTALLEESPADLAAEAAPAPVAAVPAKKPSKAPRVIGAIAIVGALAGGVQWVTHRGLETTDDAQLDGELVSVPARTQAIVVGVKFSENQTVKAGDVLAELDDAPAKARLAQADAAVLAAKAAADAADADAAIAEKNARGNKSMAQATLAGANIGASATDQQIAEGQAQVESATATFNQATTEHARSKDLFATGAISKAQLDQSETALSTATANLSLAKARLAELKASAGQARSRVREASARYDVSSDVDAFVRQAQARAATAHAQVATAQATRDLAALDVTYTKIVAPQDGIVSKKSIAVGQMVQPGTPITSLVPSKAIWVTGNFKETQLAHLRAGQPAKISVDAYGVELDGEVESFSAATGAKFALLPPDNASGNYTKVVQRVPVRVKITSPVEGIALRPGMSVDLTINTRK